MAQDFASMSEARWATYRQAQRVRQERDTHPEGSPSYREAHARMMALLDEYQEMNRTLREYDHRQFKALVAERSQA